MKSNKEKKTQKKIKSTFREYFESIFWAVLVALIIRAFLFEAFKIPSGSMIPTLQIGDHIFVNKFIYGLRIPFTYIKFFDSRIPKRGEVIVFINPRNPDQDFIKRVVGIPGDKIELKDNLLYVNDIPVKREEVGLYEYWDKDELVKVKAMRFDEINDEIQHQILTMRLTNSMPAIVKSGHVFVLGDNRDNSSDSRYIGQIPLKNIKGRASIIWWSRWSPDGVRWNRIGKLID